MILMFLNVNDCGVKLKARISQQILMMVTQWWRRSIYVKEVTEDSYKLKKILKTFQKMPFKNWFYRKKYQYKNVWLNWIQLCKYHQQCWPVGMCLNNLSRISSSHRSVPSLVELHLCFACYMMWSTTKTETQFYNCCNWSEGFWFEFCRGSVRSFSTTKH